MKDEYAFKRSIPHHHTPVVDNETQTLPWAFVTSAPSVSLDTTTFVKTKQTFWSKTNARLQSLQTCKYNSAMATWINRLFEPCTSRLACPIFTSLVGFGSGEKNVYFRQVVVRVQTRVFQKVSERVHIFE